MRENKCCCLLPVLHSFLHHFTWIINFIFLLAAKAYRKNIHLSKHIYHRSVLTNYVNVVLVRWNEFIYFYNQSSSPHLYCPYSLQYFVVGFLHLITIENQSLQNVTLIRWIKRIHVITVDVDTHKGPHTSEDLKINLNFASTSNSVFCFVKSLKWATSSHHFPDNLRLPECLSTHQVTHAAPKEHACQSLFLFCLSAIHIYSCPNVGTDLFVSPHLNTFPLYF